MQLLCDPDAIDRRLRAPLSRGEFFALALALSLAGVFRWHAAAFHYSPYLDFYLCCINPAKGDFSHVYYGYWITPLLTGLGHLPPDVGYGLLCLALIGCSLLAARVFGGSAPTVVLSYQLLYCLFVGQIAPLIVGGLALLWWGLAHRRWHWAGLGLALAAGKYQLGLSGGLILLWAAPYPWRERLKALVVPAAAVAASLVVYPGWPFQLLAHLRASPPWDLGSLAPWRWIGPWALLFWLPPLLLPLPPGRRAIALIAANALGLPYFQQTDLLLLFSLPIGWLALLGNLGYLHAFFPWTALQALGVAPLAAYLVALWPGGRRLLRGK